MKKWMLISLLLLAALGIVACDKKKGDPQEIAGQNYTIYYINTKNSELESESYQPSATNRNDLVAELLSALREEPKNILYKKAVPDNILVKESYFTGEDHLTINFDASYGELKGIPEVLCRAVIVKTLSQIEGLSYIEFNVDGQSLLNFNDTKVPLMKSEDFIDSTGTESSIPISLYFANKEGTSLIEFNSTVNFTGLNSLEESAIKQLINGPIEVGMYDTIPEGTTLLNVSTKEGICYVDFNEKFIDKIPDVTEMVAIYSVVNTLVELPNVNKVQFLINGEVQKTYREGTPFDEMFEMNLDLIQGAK